jgi:hypothetical protein
MRPCNFVRGVAVGLLAGVSWIGWAPQAHAQKALCPTAPVLSSGAAASDVRLLGGLCTNSGLVPNDESTGAFSGAALATQALTELSQTTTQETASNTQARIRDRREQEMQRCAEGFTRVDGACERIEPAPAAAVAEPSPVPVEEPAAKKSKKRVERAAVVSPRETGAAPRALRERVQPPAPAPLPVEPPVRFASWTQIYGDYEKRSAQGSTIITSNAFGNAVTDPLPLPVSVRTRTGTIGFLFGGDATFRGLFTPDDGLITGVIVGYLSSNLNVRTTSGPTGLATNSSPSDFFSSQSVFPLMGPGSSQVNANLAGLTTGGYATYFNGGFSADVLIKADVLTVDETFNEVLSFTNPAIFVPPPGAGAPLTGFFSNSGRFSLVNTTLAGNLNYRFIFNPNLWLEPMVGALYTHSAYGNGAADFGLDDADLVRVQGGARLGIPVWLNPHTLMTTTLTGLAYSDVLVSGGFVPGAAFLTSNLLAQADQGQVRGRGIAAVNFDYGNGVSSFIQGEARGGKGLFGAGGRAGVRIVW